MISYRQFREEVTPADSIIADMTKEIDALFEKLKDSVAQMTVPKRGWIDDMRGKWWNAFYGSTYNPDHPMFRRKTQTTATPPPISQGKIGEDGTWQAESITSGKMTLLEYREVESLFSELDNKVRDAIINETHAYKIDDMLNAYKEKLKQVITNYVNRVVTTPTPTKLEPQLPSSGGWTGYGSKSEKKPEIQLPEPKVNEPEVVEPPAPTPIPSKVDPEPIEEPKRGEDAVNTPKSDNNVPVDKSKLINGMIAHFAEILSGNDNPTDDDIRSAIKQTSQHIKDNSIDFNTMDEVTKKEWLRLGDKYAQKIADINAGNAPVTKANAKPSPQRTANAPTVAKKDKIKEKLFPDGVTPRDIRNEAKKSDFDEMTPKQFKYFILHEDPNMVEPYWTGKGVPKYTGEEDDDENWSDKWWRSHLRKDLVLSYLNDPGTINLRHKWKKEHHNQQESVFHKVEYYKNLLKREHRPQILIREAAQLPLQDRIKFYKEKLVNH